MNFSQFSKLIVTVVKTSMSAGVIISDPNVKMKQSEKNAKKLCHRCHNINVVALTPTCLSMWKTCPTSDPRSLSPTLIPSASSQIHQTSLLGADKCPRLVDLGDAQEVSWQPGECQQVWFHHGGGWRVRRHYRGVRQAMTPSLRSWINFRFLQLVRQR